jgi:hypothetical protein
MAQTRRKRRTKHRGNAAGTIEARGRTGRPPTAEERKRAAKESARERRLNTPPTWRQSFIRGGVAAGFMFLFLIVFNSGAKGASRFLAALLFAIVAMALYVPAGYYMESFFFRRRMRKLGRPVPPAGRR